VFERFAEVLKSLLLSAFKEFDFLRQACLLNLHQKLRTALKITSNRAPWVLDFKFDSIIAS